MIRRFWKDSPITKLIVTGAAISVGIQLFGTALGYLLQVALARWLGAAEYGAYVYARVWVDILIIPSSLGFTYSAMRFIPSYIRLEEWSSVKGIVRSGQMITIGVASLLMIGGLFFATNAGIKDYFTIAFYRTSPLTLAFGLIPLLALVTLQSEYLRALNRIALAYVPLRIVQPLVLLLLALIVYTERNTLTAKLILQWHYLLLLIVLVIQHFALTKYLPSEIWGSKATTKIGGWMKISLPLLIGGSFYSINSYFDVLVIGAFRPEQEIAIYNAALRLAALITIPLIAVRTIVTPNAAGYHAAQDDKGLKSLYRQATILSSTAGFIACITLYVAGRYLLHFFGSEFTTGYVALQILLIGALIDTVVGPIGQILNVTGYHKQTLYLTGFSALINVGLNLALIPRWGMYGAACATSISIIFLNVALYQLGAHKLKLDHALATGILHIRRQFQLYQNRHTAFSEYPIRK